MANRELPYKLFYSYATEDEADRENLETYLAVLRQENLISEWHFRDINPGSDWQNEIIQHLREARLFVPLISANFFDSNYCRSELGEAMNLRAAGEMLVLPVIVKDCEWQSTIIGDLQVLPEGATPVSLWDHEDQAWTNVAAGIRRAIASDLAAGSDHTTFSVQTVSHASSETRMSLRDSGAWTEYGVRFFTIDVEAEAVPEDGYIGWQSMLLCDTMLYELGELENEFVWPQSKLSVAVRNPGLVHSAGRLIIHGVLSGLLPPLPRSDYVGTLVRLKLECPERDLEIDHGHEVLLLSHTSENTNGAAYLHENGAQAALSEDEVDSATGQGLYIAARLDLFCTGTER